jgi:hypothetical protein
MVSRTRIPSTWLRRAAVVVLGATVMVVATGIGTANAATNYLRQHPTFAAQAQSAGLSLGQALALQSRVDGYLRAVGGVQTAANEINVNGNRLTLAVPGETRARSLTASASANGVEFCAIGDICNFSQPNYQGDQISVSVCGQLTYIPWVGLGSWANAQTGGDRATFYRGDKSVYTITCPGFCETSSFDWTPVYWVKPC